METRTSDGRLVAWIFDLPVVELRAGYRAAVYFDRSRRILAAEGDDTSVTMQVFQRSDAMVACGIDEALAVLAGKPSLRLLQRARDGLSLMRGEHRVSVRETRGRWPAPPA